MYHQQQFVSLSGIERGFKASQSADTHYEIFMLRGLDSRGLKKKSSVKIRKGKEEDIAMRDREREMNLTCPDPDVTPIAFARDSA